MYDSRLPVAQGHYGRVACQTDLPLDLSVSEVACEFLCHAVYLFEVTAILLPTRREAKEGKLPEVILPLQLVLAKDREQAALFVGGLLTEDQKKNLGRVVVKVKEF